MTRDLQLAFLGVLAIAATDSPALADDKCDIVRFKDYVTFVQDTTTNLAYLDATSKLNSTEAQSNGGASFMGFSMSASLAGKATASLQTLLDIKLTETNKKSLLVSQLNQSGQIAYIACLKAHDNLSATISDSAANNEQFFLTVRSHPQYSVSGRQRLEVKITGGKQLEKIQPTIAPQEMVIIPIERASLYKQILVSVKIGNDALSPEIALPALPKYTYVTETRSARSDSVGSEGGTILQQTRACVVADGPHEMIVPKSLRVTPVIERIARAGVVREAPELRIDDDLHKACGGIFAGAGTTESTGIGHVEVSATVLKAVPIAAVSEARAEISQSALKR
jgi:hypothetical protein